MVDKAGDNGHRFLLAHAAAMAERLERAMDQAEGQGDLAGFRSLAHESRAFRELCGRLTGALRNESSVQAVNRLVAKAGAKNEDELLDMARLVQRTPKDPHEIARTCRQYLTWYDGPGGPGQDAPAGGS